MDFARFSFCSCINFFRLFVTFEPRKAREDSVFPEFVSYFLCILYIDEQVNEVGPLNWLEEMNTLSTEVPFLVANVWCTVLMHWILSHYKQLVLDLRILIFLIGNFDDFVHLFTSHSSASYTSFSFMLIMSLLLPLLIVANTIWISYLVSYCHVSGILCFFHSLVFFVRKSWVSFFISVVSHSFISFFFARSFAFISSIPLLFDNNFLKAVFSKIFASILYSEQWEGH